MTPSQTILAAVSESTGDRNSFLIEASRLSLLDNIGRNFVFEEIMGDAHRVWALVSSALTLNLSSYK